MDRIYMQCGCVVKTETEGSEFTDIRWIEVCAFHEKEWSAGDEEETG